MRSRPRKGNPVKFAPSAGLIDTPKNVVGLRFDLHFVDGRTSIDLIPYEPRWLALLFGEELRSREIGWRRSTSIKYYRAVRKFLKFVSKESYILTTSLQLQAMHINEFERFVYSKHQEISGRPIIQAITNLISGIVEAHPSNFNNELIARVRFVSHRRMPKACTPRDTYSPYVRKQLRVAAKEGAWAAINRVATQSRTGWPKMSKNKIRAIDSYAANAGYINSEYCQILDIDCETNYFHVINNTYVFNSDDIAAMVVWVCLESGLEPECCLSLQVDAVSPRDGNVARLYYTKARSRSDSAQSILLDDRNARSVPELIRCVVKLSEILRLGVGSNSLWIHLAKKRVIEPRFSIHVGEAVRKWSLTRDILNDDGQPLRLLLSRLRKTHRSSRYQELDGDLTKFTVNHSREVAAGHYADIPSHGDLHANVVAQAQQDVVAAARHRGASIKVVPESPTGKDELWLATCEDIDNPPFGPPRKRCQIPFWGCLDCENAVFSPAKLPALIEFRDKAVEARSGMDYSDWEAKFGHAYRRIVDELLPKFSQVSLQAAEPHATSFYAPYGTFR